MTDWNGTHCGMCNQEIVDDNGNSLKGFNAQSCSCEGIFCYPECFKIHQRSTGDRT